MLEQRCAKSAIITHSSCYSVGTTFPNGVLNAKFNWLPPHSFRFHVISFKKST